MEIWLVRHGQTFGNKQQIIQGHSGGKLTNLGQQQALLNQKKLDQVHFDDIYVSDSFRTQETAQIILQSSDQSDVYLSSLLREKGGGKLEGKPLMTFRNQAYSSGLPFRDYKWDQGESWNDVHNRAIKFITNLWKLYLENEETKQEKTNINDSVKQEFINQEDEKSLEKLIFLGK